MCFSLIHNSRQPIDNIEFTRFGFKTDFSLPVAVDSYRKYVLIILEGKYVFTIHYTPSMLRLPVTI